MSLIKITLASGHVQEFPFGPTSTITVESTVSPEPSITQRKQASYSDVVAVELVEGTTDLSPTEEQELPGLHSPAGAVVFATGLPVADAAAHVEKALTRFPGDADLLAVQAELHEAVRSGAETWTTDVEVEVALEPEPEAEEPGAEAPTFDSAEAALEFAQTLAPENAEPIVSAALERWPEDAGLLAAATQLAAILAERKQ